MDEATASLKQGFWRAGYQILPQFLLDDVRERLLKHALKQAAAAGPNDDKQVPGTPAIYGDKAMERLLEGLVPVVSNIVGVPLFPTYSYFRVYKRGDTLPRHVDRPSCEVSLTLSLGYDATAPWPIWFEGADAAGAPVAAGVHLAPGDAAVYRGMDIPHWRDAFDGTYAAQVFLHYVNQTGPNSAWRFDKRARLNT